MDEKLQDELDNAYSLCFTSDGSYLYAGYKNSIRKFDVNRPGHQVSELITWSKFVTVVLHLITKFLWFSCFRCLC